MIEAQRLTRRFGAFTAVHEATFTVPDGAILALLGPNGAGKTTTVRMLAGLIGPSDGRATVAGFDIRSDPAAVRARTGLVTDAPGLYEQMTLPAYLDFFGALYGLSRAARSRRVDELIAFFDLADHRAERMAGFSKGMKQKVALARALLHEPAALFLDEPTSGLDPLAARAVRELIVSLKHASRSIILCTHDLDEAERLADQVAIINAGRIVALDTPSALRGAGASASVRVELAGPLPDASTVLADLRALGPVSDLSYSGTSLHYRIGDPRADNPRVIAALVRLGANIVTVTSEARSLEEVYADAVGPSAVEAIAPPFAEMPGASTRVAATTK